MTTGIARLRRDGAVADDRSKAHTTGAHAAVLRGIGLAILSGEFPEGSALPAKEVLMQRYGVSNTPLREALQSLTAKGLIAARTKVGTWVRNGADWNMFDPDILGWRLEVGIDDAFLAKLFEMRQAFEPVSAAVAALRRSDEQVRDMRALVLDMAAAAPDMTRFIDADLALHLLVLTASANPFMRSIGALIRTALAASFASSAPSDDPRRAERAVAQHAAIVEAIARGQPQEAADAMMTVIRQGWLNTGCRTVRPLAALSTGWFDMADDRAAEPA